MNIKQASVASGLPAKTIRYYEDVKLLTPLRSGNGYRVFSDSDINRLKFLGVSRSLGFPVAVCRQLLGLYEDKSRASSEVKALAQLHLSQIDAKLKELEAMRASLAELVSACRGDDRPDCPIMERLASNPPEEMIS